MDCNIMIAGVGGQGTLLASRVIGNTAIRLRLDVKVSEVHGMSQRGGSVVTYVKFSDTKVSSPVIYENNADFILAFELLEAYRCLPFLKKDGKLIMNNRMINPMPVITGDMTYPKDIGAKLTQSGINFISLDALSLAQACGSEKAVNLILIGTLAKNMNIKKDTWLSVIKETVPQKFLNINLKAFEVGWSGGIVKKTTSR